MKKYSALILMLAFILPMSVMASSEKDEKPVKHLKIADVTSMSDAKSIFIKSTSDIKRKKKLDPVELQAIHTITYSLEKSVAYYSENLTGDTQKLAKEIAVIVEDIHVSSENNRKDETESLLGKYYNLADKLMTSL